MTFTPRFALCGVFAINGIHVYRVRHGSAAVKGQSEGNKDVEIKNEIHPGDTVWFPPGEKRWHGGTPTAAMTHIAIQEQLDGKAADWMEEVSDEQDRQ